MSKPREFWIRNNDKEFGIDGQRLGHVAFESPFGVKGKDGKDCELIHVREITDQPDLAPGILKSIEMLDRNTNHAHSVSCSAGECDACNKRWAADWLRAEAIKQGILKE